MNHIYRTVFNRSLGIYQVASELASSAGGQSSMKEGTASTSHALGCEDPSCASSLRPVSWAVQRAGNPSGFIKMGWGMAILLAAFSASQIAHAEIVINTNQTFASDADIGPAAEAVKIEDTGTATLTGTGGTGTQYFQNRTITLGSGDSSGPNEGKITVTSGISVINSTATINGGTLVKNGGGILRINTDQVNYSHTVINGGTLDLGTVVDNRGSLGSGSVQINSGNLQFSNSGTKTFSNEISGSGNLIRGSGSHTTILTGNNTYGGTTSIGSSARIVVGDGGVSGSIGSGDVILQSASSRLEYNLSRDVEVTNIITGLGRFIQSGTGNTTLTGVNTYSGGTIINDGTLSISSNANLGAAASGVTINNGAALAATATTDLGARGVTLGTGGGKLEAVGSGTDLIVGGTVSGTSLTTGGEGRVILGGTNTYTGGTTVDGGTLSISSNDNLGAATGGVTLNNGAALAATTTTDLGARDVTLGAGGGTLEAVGSGTDLIVGGTVSGTSLTTGGEGRVILGGTNTYTGGTTVDGGTLSISSNDNLGAATGGVTLNNGAALAATATTDLGARDVTLGAGGGTLEAVSSGTDLIVGGTVSGTDLTTAGAGTVILGGTNTYGKTNVSSGSTLQVGNGAAAGTLGTDAVSNDGTLVFNRSDDVTVGNDISGAGDLTQAGTGTTTLTGTNSYSGTTTIDDGTLKIGDGGATGTLGSGPIINNSALEFDRSGSLNVAGAISGTGSVTQSGPGTTTLSGANTYSGETLVNAGVLQAGADNSLSSNSVHTVASGATLDLAGHAQTLPGLNNSGLVNLAGPAQAGTNVLTVTGPYVGNGGTLNISATPSTADKLLLSGPNASASGSTVIQINDKKGLGAATTGDGLSVVGLENGATMAPGSFTLAGDHVDAGAYEYRLAENANGLAFQSSKIAPDSGGQVTTYRAEVPLLAALPGQMRQADLDMLGNLHVRQGAGSAQGSGTAENNAGMDRRVWGRVLRTDPTIRQNNGEARPHTSGHMTGFQAGLDLFANQSMRAGLYVGQLEGDLSVRGNSAGVQRQYVGFNNLRTRYLGVYGTWQDTSGLYADAVVQAADYRSHLHTAENSLASRTARTKGSGWLASLEVGQPFAMGSNWQIEPQVQLIYRKISVDDTFLDAAQVKTSADGDWTLRLGARIKGSFATSAGALQPYARVNLYRSSSTTDTARFITPVANTALQTRGGSTSTELAAGASLQVSPATSVYAELGKLWANGGNSRVGSGTQASLGVRVRW